MSGEKMRYESTVAALTLGVFLLAQASSHAAELRAEKQVDIPANIGFKTIPSPQGVTWIVDVDIDAKVRYSGAMGEPTGNFNTRITVNSITSSEPLSYTDKKTGQTATAPTVFSPGDSIIDELGARKQFNDIKLVTNAYFAVHLSGLKFDTLTHVFWDQEIFGPNGEWGYQGTSVFDWEDFLMPGAGGWKYDAPDFWEVLQNNKYTEDERKRVKEIYATVVEAGSIAGVTLLDNPKPEFAGLYEFENAIMEGLRAKVNGMPKKPVVTAKDLKAAFGGTKKEAEKGRGMSAADLKRAFGGTPAVPIDEMNRGSGNMTAADLKKAFTPPPPPSYSSIGPILTVIHYCEICGGELDKREKSYSEFGSGWAHDDCIYSR